MSGSTAAEEEVLASDPISRGLPRSRFGITAVSFSLADDEDVQGAIDGVGAGLGDGVGGDTGGGVECDVRIGMADIDVESLRAGLGRQLAESREQASEVEQRASR